MADNVAITPGAGASVAADDIGGVFYQRVKVAVGADGAAADVHTGNPLPIHLNALASIGTATATVTTAGTRIQLATNACSSVTVRARPGNTGVVYVGGSDVAAANGFELEPGDAVVLDVANTNLIWLDAATSGAQVRYIWVA